MGRALIVAVACWSSKLVLCVRKDDTVRRDAPEF